ncbi:hypothetical protein R3P38DRAFT_3036950 [Favolaschia claudopus]|uniref:C2H2-type domain-containing protein n=1 Tax=Favolaschia claudopus TaxID=2862362 RepID=A0AAW0AAY9_9AGAR
MDDTVTTTLSYFMDDNLSVTPATPPQDHDILDLNGLQSPTSEHSNYGSGHSPTLSDDNSYHSPSEFTSGRSQFLTLSPTTSSPQFLLTQEINEAFLPTSPEHLSPEASLLSIPHSQYQTSMSSPLELETQLPGFESQGYSLDPNSVVYPAFDGHSMLFGTSLYAGQGTPNSGHSHSRTQSSVTLPTDLFNERRTAPVRRRSFNEQWSYPSQDRAAPRLPFVGSFSAPATPETSMSLFSPASSVSQMTPPDPLAGLSLPPPLHPHVASDATVHAATSRRKKPANHRCTYCQATFTTPHNLNNHINSHNGIRPHRCECGDRFTTLSVFKRHRAKSCPMSSNTRSAAASGSSSSSVPSA